MGRIFPPYDVPILSEEGRLKRETTKRDYLRLEDLSVGAGPLAAQGRRLTANVEVRYDDGTVVYRGTIITYPGFGIDLLNSIRDRVSVTAAASARRRRESISDGMAWLSESTDA